MHTKPCLLSALLILGLLACEESDLKNPAYLDCQQMKQGLLELDEGLLANEVDRLAQDLSAQPTTADPQGHLQNLETMVSRMNSQCSDLDAEIRCYACISTLPVQSEILVHLDSVGIQVSRVIDLFTSSDAPLTFRAVHL